MDKWQELTVEVLREAEEAASNILIELVEIVQGDKVRLEIEQPEIE